MKLLAGEGIIIWCPNSKEDVGRVASAIVKATEMGMVGKVTVVIPLDPKPKCHEVNQFTDLWTHELLQGKWAAFTEKIQFSAEPVKIVVSGSFAPMHQTKSLCMVTLGTRGGKGEIGMMVPRGSIGKIETREVVIIDMAEEEEVEFVKAMDKMKQEIIESWHGPSRAPSSRGGDRRLGE